LHDPFSQGAFTGCYLMFTFQFTDMV